MPDNWSFILSYSEFVEFTGNFKGYGESKASPTSKMMLIVTIVINGWQSWPIITKSSILDFAAVLGPPRNLQSLRKEFFKLEINFSKGLCSWMFSQEYSKNSKKIFLTEKF